MQICDVLGFSMTSALLAEESLGRTALGDDVALAGPPGIYIVGGGPGGGGSRPNFLEAIFPGGGVSSPAAIQTVAANHHLADSLISREILYDVRPVSGFKMPQLRALFAIPAPMASIVGAMNDVNQWPAWMPRFDQSVGRPAGRPGAQYQEAKMSAAGLTIHYQVLVESASSDEGHLIRWRLDEKGFRKRFGTLGLQVNDGSFAAVPLAGHPDETLVAYFIHTQVKPLLPGTASSIQNATIQEFPGFPGSLARRSLNPAWTQRSGANSAGPDYRMRRPG